MDEAGSIVAPLGDGNTKSPNSAKKKPREAGKIHWFLTLIWPHGSNLSYVRELERWLKLHVTRYTMQLERGEETGYEHMHMQITTKTKKRFEWFKTHLSRVVNCEVTRNIEAAFGYCMKEETRIAGPWVYPEPPLPGVRDPLAYIPLKHWQAEIKQIIDGDVCPRTIYWYYDPIGGTGKTHFGRHLMIHYDIAFFQGGKKADMAHSWRGEKICLFNFSRETEGHVSYDTLESLKDGLIFSGKYESGVKFYEQPHVIVFANWPPNLDALSHDRWNVVEIC